MNYEAEIKQHIVTQVLADDPAGDVAVDEPLISSGRVDSLGLVQILMFIQQKFGVDLMTVGTPQDFDSVAALAAAVRRHKDGE